MAHRAMEQTQQPPMIGKSDDACAAGNTGKKKKGYHRAAAAAAARRRSLSSFVLPLLLAASVLFVLTSKARAYNVVRVCRNKHCCKKSNADVLQTMHNLIDTDNNDIKVESSGCLSNCDKGPNVEITTKSGSTVVLNGMTDAQTCAFRLGEVSSSTPESFPPVPKILIAASKVIEQSRRFADSGQLEEEIRFLTSVIDKLESSPAVSPSTAANADAHALRAQARLEVARKQKEPSGVSSSEDALLREAICDARRVVRDLSGVAAPASLSLAYRTWTDAELFLAQEREVHQQHHQQQATTSKAVAVLTEWYRAQPMYRTKLQGEIRGLLSA